MKLNNINVKGIPLQILDNPESWTTYWVEQELNNGGYKLDLLDISESDTIIDIGANTGIFAIYAAKKFGCRIISFEPVPQIYENAVNNLKLNSADNVEIHNCGISDKEGLITICFDPQNSGGSSHFKSGNSILCKTEPLHKYLEEKNLKFLKIDCEGGEYDIIPSILQHLNKFKYLAIEYHKYNEEQDPVKLHQMILDNFNGELICNDPHNPITW